MTGHLHCLAPFGGSLGTDQLGRPGIPGLGSFTSAGSPKGTAVVMHALNESIPASPILATDAWSEALLADNWSVLLPSHPEDGCATGTPAQALAADVAADTYNGGKGARYLETMYLWWTHVVEWCARYSPGPILLCGFSEGAYYCLQLLGSQQLGTGPGEIIGSVLHCPIEIWSNANLIVTNPADFNTLDTSGMDVSPTVLNGIGSTPVMVSYGTTDQAVGWSGVTTLTSTVADVTAFTTGSPGTLNIGSNSGFVNTGSGFFGAAIKVATSAGFATMTFTGMTSTTLTGCVTRLGTGSASSGASVVQSLTNEIITIAQGAGANVTRNPTTDDHTFTSADVTGTFIPFIQANIDTLV